MAQRSWVCPLRSIEFRPEIFEFKKLAAENIKLIEKQAFKKQLLIIMAIKEEISVNADKNMLHTVLRNLLTNAIKFTALMAP